MEEKSIWRELKDVLTTIVGHWYAEAADQTLIFSLCEKPMQDAKLLTINKDKKTMEDVYSVGAYLGDSLESLFYIDIGMFWDTKRWYKIKEISPAKMVIIEIEKAAGRKEISNEFSYIRKQV
jgi:hypothetical protein